MKKAVSFSLWGDNPMYCVGAIKNAELMPLHYPDWEMLVFYDNTVPNHYIERLQSINVKCFDVTEKKFYGMFYRFLALDMDYEYCIFRDCDSRISKREAMAVQEWIESGKFIHRMIDHPAHIIPYFVKSNGTINNEIGLLGGMCGMKGLYTGGFPLVEETIIRFHKSKNGSVGYGSDQEYLQYFTKQNEYYKLGEVFSHDEFSGIGKPFPIPREDYHFIGERFDENDVRAEDYKALIKK